ncbi:hypothetical protein LTR78_002566 [Recurvomyces mirabilis]|uniref:Heterokaryon incompatibility domain-containing protein n=1 Tax=Recurvomyces mirabilis TaxID=574656 RepID=A0AAE1C4K1_9PEZI|nr:hypothetical protein LTR78_002566 [Recurvomyces mirabilis]KAK5157495.1 hypothetical protein LTS14_004260 [Recurvomyces mirabilis]
MEPGMRLLDVDNLDSIRLVEFSGDINVEYTILSHCWSHDETTPEVDYRSFCMLDYDVEGAGWRKILKCCELTKAAGHRYTWIDTCCIDKSSSAELSESINSMFTWYKNAVVCYVFMNNCHVMQLPPLYSIDREERWQEGLDRAIVQDVETFTDDRWFTRGWTLQELVAPSSLVVYNSDYACLGTKKDLVVLLSHATGIEERYLAGEDIAKASVAQRMSWASRRTTHRIEDVAYSMLGIFDVNMPLLYGEGSKAFLRLQEEILRRIDDQSVLAWGLKEDGRHLSGVLADHPRAFKDCHFIVKHDPSGAVLLRTPYNLTPKGLALYQRSVFRMEFLKSAAVSMTEGSAYDEHAIDLDCYEAGPAKSYQRHNMQSRIRLMICHTQGSWYRSRVVRHSVRKRSKMQIRVGIERIVYVSTTGNGLDHCRLREVVHNDTAAPRAVLDVSAVAFLAILVTGLLYLILIARSWPESYVLTTALVILTNRLLGDGGLFITLLLGVILAAAAPSEHSLWST